MTSLLTSVVASAANFSGTEQGVVGTLAGVPLLLELSPGAGGHVTVTLWKPITAPSSPPGAIRVYFPSASVTADDFGPVVERALSGLNSIVAPATGLPSKVTTPETLPVVGLSATPPPQPARTRHTASPDAAPSHRTIEQIPRKLESEALRRKIAKSPYRNGRGPDRQS